MDINGLKKCESNLNWLAENKTKISLQEFFHKMFEDTNATVEDEERFAEVIKSTLVEAKRLNKI